MSKSTWMSAIALFGMTMSLAAPAHAVVRGKPVHALALYGEAKYGPDQPFDYYNLDAPKGGTLKMMAATPTFDSMNPFSRKGVAMAGLAALGSNGPIIEGLTTQGDDEPFTQYCLLCETMEIAEDNTWIEYTLRPEAKFSDGTPVTADDVVFSFEQLKAKGMPLYQLYWADISKAEKTGPMKVKFFSKNPTNNELFLIMGQLPVISKAFWTTHDLAESTLDPIVSTGPYTIDSFEPGRFVVLKRNPNYWGKDLVITRGTYNFDFIRFEYFRDDTVSFEAFKTSGFDVIAENTARRWATGYDFPAFNAGQVKKLEVTSATPMAAQGFMYNLRRDKFKDRRVRQALNYAFDFESLNKNIFYEQYARIRSYFQRSDMEATGLPGPEELAILEPLRGKVPDEVFTQEFIQPTTAGNGDTRDNLLKARTLLAEAGWDIVNGQLTNKKTGEIFTFEIVETQATLDRIVLPWAQNLEKLGIKATFRVIDASQIVTRMNEFDFDATISGIQNSLSPGNEQAEYWGSAAADHQGSRNVEGVKDPAVDAIVAALLTAKDRPALVAASKALDRVLTWNYYMTLQYSSVADRFAYWTKLKYPPRFPMQGLGAAGVAVSWWLDPAAAATPPATSATPGSGATEPASYTWLIVLIVVVLAAGAIIFMRRRKA